MIHVGDCLEVMRGMADNSVDAIVTDPPYSQDPEKALAEWRRINWPALSARPAPKPEVADSLVQFNLSLAEQPAGRKKAAGGAHGSR
ncbi:TPA: site-specific DNA-methyltransferase [Stenotrophomonas maltophilia]|nr:site-specific DNA-methyltransferase [Stenotrophomonas maltophilia]HDS1042738.1 site-specific DNA-methyltransferase [Stenotrophomonas maltophilia]